MTIYTTLISKTLKKEFKLLKNKKNKMREAHKILKLKFSGKLLPQEKYMKRSVFKNKFKKIPNLLGVIFIHDFYDPHIATEPQFLQILKIG